MPKIVLPQKASNETIAQVFDFTSFIPITDTIVSSVSTVSVYSGTDITPGAIIAGLPSSISGATVTQGLTGGVDGVTYLVSVSATTSSGVISVLTGYLAVLRTSL